jgi:chemosensory pili system protein ChpC
MSNLDQAAQGQPDQPEGHSAIVPSSGVRVRIVRLPTQVANLEVIVPYGLIAEINEVMLPEGETHLSRLDAAMVDWRAQRVPLVSLEAMLNEPLPTIGQRVRCAVLYGTNPDIALPYYAILLSGVPRSEEVTGESFSEESLGDSGIWGMTALLGDRRIAIPDVRSLELRIDEMRLRFEQELTPPAQ